MCVLRRLTKVDGSLVEIIRRTSSAVLFWARALRGSVFEGGACSDQNLAADPSAVRDVSVNTFTSVCSLDSTVLTLYPLHLGEVQSQNMSESSFDRKPSLSRLAIM